MIQNRDCFVASAPRNDVCKFWLTIGQFEYIEKRERNYSEEYVGFMEILTEKRRQAREQYRRHETDSGSAEVQIAVLTTRITHLTDHLKDHSKDHSSRRGLIKMVGKRNALLKYLKETQLAKYHKIIAGLGLRK
jgi:small subunit ribosomal protein S15